MKLIKLMPIEAGGESGRKGEGRVCVCVCVCVCVRDEGVDLYAILPNPRRLTNTICHHSHSKSAAWKGLLGTDGYWRLQAGTGGAGWRGGGSVQSVRGLPLQPAVEWGGFLICRAASAALCAPCMRPERVSPVKSRNELKDISERRFTHAGGHFGPCLFTESKTYRWV